MENHELKIIERWLQKVIRPVVHDECRSLLDRITEVAEKKTPKYYSRSEVCRKLGISRATFHNWSKKGVFQITKINGRVYVDAEVLDAFMKHQNK